ncbi:hypothetical protein Cgig2_001138 [Carnegiea gigantea]|uniref:Uncharacterized protein n=1 Tax=Carnegiea gigantea TaxID=171969 RepID=A0A9Q1JHA1_9CARY|nr:hypothetical protein Cgig2_001138 [Carnegiea gigantea]
MAETPGEPMSLKEKMIDEGAEIMQPLKPVKQLSQHVCTFAIYSHDMHRQIETHHFIHRLNQDFCQCAVYDSDDPSARLIGVEYIISQRLFDALPPDEQKLWHSHFYEIHLDFDFVPGDHLPLGEPALMMSPQKEPPGVVKPPLVHHRDQKYNISSEKLSDQRAGITGPATINQNADYWKQHKKGFAVDIVTAEMKKIAPFP